MKEENFHTLGNPFTGRDRGWGASEPRRRAQQQGSGGQSGEIPAQRIGANQHSPAREACLLTRWGGWGLGAEARALEIRPQGEDRSWLFEDSLKGASVPQLAGRESGEKSGAAGETRGHCFRVHEEKGFLFHVPTDGRAPPKQAPEMAASHDYRLGHQRRAQTAAGATAAKKSPVCKCRSLPTPSREPVPLTTARVPSSRANFPRSTHGASQAVATLTSADAGIPPHSPIMTTLPLPPPGLSEQESPNQPLL